MHKGRQPHKESEGSSITGDIIAGLSELKTSASDFLDGTSNVVIYGAGNIGRQLCTFLADRGISVSYFLDRKAQPDSQWNGVPIFHPEDERIPDAGRGQTHVIIGIFNRDAEVLPIVRALEAKGYHKVTSFPKFHSCFADEFGDMYWLTSRSTYGSAEAEIAEGLSVWADELSRRLYTAVLKYRLTGDEGVLPRPDMKHQYFPEDIPKWNTPVRFVDCGAFDGDTAADLLANFEAVEAVAAFEPNQANFAKLAAFVRKNLPVLGDVCLWPCAVYSHDGQLRFSSDKGEANRLENSGSELVQCVSLDTAIPGFRPTLLKLDVEGAECEALLGARRLICSNRPGLAVCLYHHPEHLWQVPLLLQRWQCGYDFYLRSHAFNGFDLVMYGVPKN